MSFDCERSEAALSGIDLDDECWPRISWIFTSIDLVNVERFDHISVFVLFGIKKEQLEGILAPSIFFLNTSSFMVLCQ